MIDKTIPSSIRYADEKIIFEEGKSETEALSEIGKYAEENKVGFVTIRVLVELTNLIRNCSFPYARCLLLSSVWVTMAP